MYSAVADAFILLLMLLLHASGDPGVDVVFAFAEVIIKKNTICAADFSLLNLPKGKSLGRSKPATNS
jgi:hypothetical protein